MAFAVDIVLMGVIATFIYYSIFKKTGGNVLYVLLIGTVLSTFFFGSSEISGQPLLKK